MNVDIIILQQSIDTQFLKRYNIIEVAIGIFSKFGTVPTIHFDTKGVTKDKYYLLFCLEIDSFKKEFENFSSSTIFMSCGYSDINEITSEHNFAGFATYVQFSQNLPIMYGLKKVVENMEVESPAIGMMISSDKYTSFHNGNRKGITALALDYLEAYTMVEKESI